MLEELDGADSRNHSGDLGDRLQEHHPADCDRLQCEFATPVLAERMGLCLLVSPGGRNLSRLLGLRPLGRQM